LVLRSPLLIAYKFGDLSLQELEPWEITVLGTGRLPPALVRVDLINEAQLRHRFVSLGNTDSDPIGDKADHTLAVTLAIIDPISLSPDFDFDGDREVFKVGDR
jgi:hypothetical protein